MLGSWSNTLLSVRQVTQRNAGRRTAGIDGQVALVAGPGRRWRCGCTARSAPGTRAGSAGVYPEGQRKTRPLGIPVMMDRCHQARVRNALEPEWEARFEPRSYGFRPGRGCADAIAALFTTLKGTSQTDVDLGRRSVGGVRQNRPYPAAGTRSGIPGQGPDRGWLKAGVIEDGRVHADRGGNSTRRCDQPVC